MGGRSTIGLAIFNKIKTWATVCLVCMRSKYDKYILKENNKNATSLEASNFLTWV